MADPLAGPRGLLSRLRGPRVETAMASRSVRAHPAVAGAVATAAVAAGAATMVLRRLLASPPGPLPGMLAQAAAVSVWDAAKGSVIETVRNAGSIADLAMVEQSSTAAVLEASGAGADVTAAALGAVEGALGVAHLLSVSRSEAATVAADAATSAARTVGVHAAARVEQALADRFPDELRRSR